MSKPLKIVITGASSGIGRAAALELACENSLFITSRRTKKLNEVAEEIEVRGGKAWVGVGDIRNAHDIEQLSKTALKKLGGVDVLFANAGIGFFGPLEQMTLEQYNLQFDTNVRGVFLWIKHLLPEMKKQKSGQIIATSSNLGLETSPRASIYSASKHAVQALIWCLREELKGTGVKAATINPGSVSTPWFDGKNVDRSRMLSEDDIAKAVRYIINQSNTSNIDHILIRPNR